MERLFTIGQSLDQINAPLISVEGLALDKNRLRASTKKKLSSACYPSCIVNTTYKDTGLMLGRLRYRKIFNLA